MDISYYLNKWGFASFGMTLVRDAEFLKLFGDCLRKLRKEHEMSQYMLADIANINRSQVIEIEKGEVNPTICTLKVLAEALEIPLHELVDV